MRKLEKDDGLGAGHTVTQLDPALPPPQLVSGNAVKTDMAETIGRMTIDELTRALSRHTYNDEGETEYTDIFDSVGVDTRISAHFYFLLFIFSRLYFS